MALYAIELSRKAIKYLDKLPRDAKERIMIAIERCRIRPFHYVERLIGEPFYRLKVGDYRVIMDIQSSKVFILVVRVGHRKNVYKHL